MVILLSRGRGRSATFERNYDRAGPILPEVAGISFI